MTTPTPSPLTVSGTQIMWAVVVLVLGSFATVAFLAFALPEGSNPALYVGLVFQTLLQVLGIVGLLFKVGQVSQGVSAIRNGEMEAKLSKVMTAHDLAATEAAEAADRE